ncbi:MAG: YibE/F family protein [Eubacterium ventriosum]
MKKSTTKDRSLHAKELFKSGINVGKDMMGTMSNTLNTWLLPVAQ